MEQIKNSSVNNQAVNMAAQQNTKERRLENQKEAKQGTVTRDFNFEKKKEKVEQLLQRLRSQEYLTAIDMVDFVSADDEEIIERLMENLGKEFVEEMQEMVDSVEEMIQMITDAFHNEFSEMEINLDDEMIAVLSKCYIEGCDCHAIDQYGNILDHYREDEHLSEALERGRKIFREHSGECQCVEVYKTCCRIVSRSGDVEVIKNN